MAALEPVVARVRQRAAEVAWSEAETAAIMALKTIERHADLPPARLLEECHNALRSTRGAVVGIAKIDRERRTLAYAGLGNIEARIVSEHKVYRPVSVNGIAGHSARKFREETFPFERGDLLVLHSDGISDRFELSSRARSRDPQMLAAQIAMEFGRSHDDQLLLIVREAP
jgi:hypothetical protein